MPLAIDLFCGLGGWTEGLLAEGYYVVGFDIEQHVYGEHHYPAQLVIQDVLTLDGAQFKDAALIVASPPCQEYSYMAMPWKVAKQRAADYRSGVRDVRYLTKLFDACFRIQREASGAAGHHIPLVVENVRGAIPWVGRSRWNYGSYHLWGDVPALMPMTFKGVKVPGMNWSGSDKPGYKAQASNDTAIKNLGGSWFAVSHNKVPHSRGDGIKNDGRLFPNDCADLRDDIKCGGDWFGPSEDRSAMRNHHSRSPKRKMASAMIAKIPLPLSRHIARVYRPKDGLLQPLVRGIIEGCNADPS